MSNPENLDNHRNENPDSSEHLSCVVNTTMNNVLSELSNSEYRIDFDEERVKRIFNLAINVFDEFHEDEDSFGDIVNRELERQNLDIGFDIFNKILSTFCSVRNFCEQFDKVYKSDGWEELCESTFPELVSSTDVRGF
jgi:hypothetical protein